MKFRFLYSIVFIWLVAFNGYVMSVDPAQPLVAEEQLVLPAPGFPAPEHYPSLAPLTSSSWNLEHHGVIMVIDQHGTESTADDEIGATLHYVSYGLQSKKFPIFLTDFVLENFFVRKARCNDPGHEQDAALRGISLDDIVLFHVVGTRFFLLIHKSKIDSVRNYFKTEN